MAKWKQDEYYKWHNRIEKWELRVGEMTFTLCRIIKKDVSPWFLESGDFLWGFVVGTDDFTEAKALVENAIKEKCRSMLKEME